MHLFFERESVLRIGSCYRFRRVDTVARLHFFDAIANRLDHSRGIRTRRVGKRGLHGVSARAHVGVVGIHTGRMDTDKNLSGGRLGRGDLFELQDFGTAEFTNENSFHFFSPAKKLAKKSGVKP